MFKVGDRVLDISIQTRGTIMAIDPEGELSVEWEGCEYDPEEAAFWPASDFVRLGPVRTVTRKEIVGGAYGDVTVGEVGPSGERVPICIPNRFYSAKEIRAAIATLLEIAEALE